MTSSPGEAAAAVAPEKEGHFKRALGIWDATAVVVGSMIGSGIFIVSADIARQVGSSGWLLACWIIAGLLTIAAALCYSELAAMYPKAGGQYVFLRQAFGPLFAFLYGWTLFAVIQSGTIAAVGVGFAKFLGVFVPWVSKTNTLLQCDIPYLAGGQPWHWQLSTQQIVALGLIALLTAVNCRGIEAAKFIQTTFTAAKLFALAAIIVLGFLAFDKFQGLAVNFQDMWTPKNEAGAPLGGLQFALVMGGAMVGALFSCDAWNNITFAGEEVKDAEKILPRSLAFGTLAVVALYILANIVYLFLLPLHGAKDGGTILARGIQYATEDRVATAITQILFGDVGAFIMAGAIMISTFGCLNGLILAGARVYYAMAKDGLFFKRAGHLDSVTNVPVFGLVIQGVWSALLATTGTYGDLLNYVVFAALLFYVLTVLAVFVLRKKEPNLERPYKVPAYPILPALYIVAAIGTMVGMIFQSPIFCLAGLGLIVTGLPAYALFKTGTAKPETLNSA